MRYKVTRPGSGIDVSITLPASKSISNRLLIIHALAEKRGRIENLSDSDDTRVMLDALSSGDLVKDIEMAGTSMRFLTAYYSVQHGKVQITGSARMKKRPIGPLVDALRKLGADITYLEEEGFPPLEITGKRLQGGEIDIDSSISSQFISALLMIAPLMEKGLTLHLLGAGVSSSYIKMTLNLMSEYGAKYSWEGETISVEPGAYRSGEYFVESDWSAASYWYIIGLLAESSHIRLSYLNTNGLQGDSVLPAIFQKLGLKSEFQTNTIILNRPDQLQSGLFSYDFSNSPDIVQSLAVALCMANIPFKFTGTTTLRIKETDRIFALQTELRKLGYMLESDEKGSFLSWTGERCTPEQEPLIMTYHDHRMAMAFAPVALLAGTIIIDDPMVVTKSYPRFWEDLKSVGFQVKEV